MSEIENKPENELMLLGIEKIGEIFINASDNDHIIEKESLRLSEIKNSHSYNLANRSLDKEEKEDSFRRIIIYVFISIIVLLLIVGIWLSLINISLGDKIITAAFAFFSGLLTGIGSSKFFQKKS